MAAAAAPTAVIMAPTHEKRGVDRQRGGGREEEGDEGATN